MCIPVNANASNCSGLLIHTSSFYTHKNDINIPLCGHHTWVIHFETCTESSGKNVIHISTRYVRTFMYAFLSKARCDRQKCGADCSFSMSNNQQK